MHLWAFFLKWINGCLGFEFWPMHKAIINNLFTDVKKENVIPTCNFWLALFFGVLACLMKKLFLFFYSLLIQKYIVVSLVSKLNFLRALIPLNFLLSTLVFFFSTKIYVTCSKPHFFITWHCWDIKISLS